MNTKQKLLLCLPLLAAIALFSSVGNADSLRKVTGLSYWDQDRAFEGYTLFGAQGNNIAYAIDMQGNVVHSWKNAGSNPRLIDNGNIMGYKEGGLVEVDWDDNVVWSFKDEREGYRLHHDFVRGFNPKLNAPTTFFLSNRQVTHEECIALGCDPANGPYDNSEIDTVVEVDMDGNIVWEWRFVDHLIQDVDPTKKNYVGEGKTIADYPHRLDANLPGRPVRRDWLHLNAIDYNEELDLLMFDTVQGEVYIIDHGNTFVPHDLEASMALAASAKGDILYRFGDPARYEQGDPPSINEDWTSSTTGHKQIGGIHDIQWIEEGLPGAGNILMFNNAQYLFERVPQSYILEINPYLDSDGTDTGEFVNPPDAGYYVLEPTDQRNTHKQPKNMSNQIVWMYGSKSAANFFSHIGSGAQRLPNGNTLICADTEGQIFEVTSEGELAWEYINPISNEDGEAKQIMVDTAPMQNQVFRAYRYSADHPTFAGRDLKSLGPIGSQ